VRLYFRFTLSLRDVEDLLAERGINVTYETIRCWADKLGPAIASNIRKRRGLRWSRFFGQVGDEVKLIPDVDRAAISVAR